MSTMAKVFVVVNLVLTLVVFGGAATMLGAQDNYKKALEQAKSDHDKYYADAEKEKVRLDGEVTTQTNLASRHLGAKTTAEAEVQAMRTLVQDTKLLLDKASSTNQSFAAELKELRTINDNYKTLVESTTKGTSEATQRMEDYKSKLEAEVQNRVRLQGDLDRTAEERAALAAELADTRKSLAEARSWLDEYRARFGDITGGSKGAKGVVRDVKGDLVGISVGTNDGVRMGDEYHLSRGGSYVGRITIIQVSKDLAVGRFDSANAGSGAPPQVGDSTWSR
ncbi:MAG: hypothetical protein ACT4PV_08815 [Planctomycetaceae bacterium]